MSQWYLSYKGKQFGPFDVAKAVRIAEEHPDAFAWREGFVNWVPVSQIAELTTQPPHIPSPPVPEKPPGADVIDYKIFGAEMQFVEVELDPGESAVAEAGAMMYKDSSIHMQTVFGDASASEQDGGFMSKLLGAGKRLLTGESLFMTIFTHTGRGKAHVAFGAPYPGNIIPVYLEDIGGCLICQKDSFLCAAKGVSIGIYLQRRILTGLFGGEGFVMQKLEGNGQIFMHAGGTVVERQLEPDETLHIDTGCLVAMESTVAFEIEQAGNIKTALFGGEGLFFARVKGPGKIWMQSLPFSRLAGRMLQSAPQRGGNRGEGSLLGSLGDIINGDKNY